MRLGYRHDTVGNVLARNSHSFFKCNHPRKEKDAVEILSGVFEGKTTGTPLCGVIYNTELINPDCELLAKANRIAYRCVERHEDLADAIREMHSTDGAFLLECRVEKEENVFPMVPAGAPVHDIRLE